MGELATVGFSRVRYSQLGAISVFHTKKADATELFKIWTNILIQAAQTVNQGVIGAEILECWYCLKIHGMPLEKYLSKEIIELFRREVESSTRIQLKTTLQWLIYEDRLKEQ